MNYRRRFLSLLVLFLCVLALVHTSFAESIHGLKWDIPSSKEEQTKALLQFKELGFQLLVIDKLVEADVMDQLHFLGFKVIIQIPNPFVTAHQLWSSPETVKARSNDYLIRYQPYAAVIGFSVFEDPQWKSPFFKAESPKLIEEFRSRTNKPLWFTSSIPTQGTLPTQFDGVLHRVETLDQALAQVKDEGVIGLLYHPNASTPYVRNNIQRLFRETGSVPLFFDGAWLQQAMEKDDVLSSMIKAFITDPSQLFPNPVPPEIPAQSDYVVLILLVVLIVFGFHYGFEPNYRKSLIRYFLNHGFFISDILERRIRFSRSNLLVFFQQAILGGLLLYALGIHLFSHRGYEAFVYHFDLITIYTDQRIGMFLAGFILFGALQLVNLLWLHYTQKELGFISQTATIYLWPTHINLSLMIFLLTLLLADGSEWIIYILSFLILSVPSLSFYFAATDIAARHASKFNYFLKTLIPHLFLSIAFLIWIEARFGIIDAIVLAEQLP